MQLSILVISRTAPLLNTMLASLGDACSLPAGEVEVLCSWNGSMEEERAIKNESNYELLIAQRIPYHFATNMNGLADKATGTYLLLINDDVVLDSGSVDAALRCLQSNPNAGIVGARLRHSNGLLAHAGMAFDTRNNAYHVLENLLPADCDWAKEADRPVPVVTGALMLLARKTFQQLRFQEQYRQCGEDVELCLDLRQHLNQHVWLCAGASGIHESETTREKQEVHDYISEDKARIRARYCQFLSEASTDQLQLELRNSQQEAHLLREVVQSRSIENKSESLKKLDLISKLESELDIEKKTTTKLHLHRLKLEQDISQLQAELRNQMAQLKELKAMTEKAEAPSKSWILPRLRR